MDWKLQTEFMKLKNHYNYLQNWFSFLIYHQLIIFKNQVSSVAGNVSSKSKSLPMEGTSGTVTGKFKNYFLITRDCILNIRVLFWVKYIFLTVQYKYNNLSIFHNESKLINCLVDFEIVILLQISTLFLLFYLNKSATNIEFQA